jgi:hypothetical protein
MVKLTSGVMPPSNVGRKPKPLDSELVEALQEALENALPEAVETENFETKLYPAFFGPDFSEAKHAFNKEHQAQAEGRKYAGPVAKRIGKVVRVNVYSNGVSDADGKPIEATRYAWRLYVPVSEYSPEELEELLDGPGEAAGAAEAAGEAEEAIQPDTPEAPPEPEPAAEPELEATLKKK